MRRLAVLLLTTAALAADPQGLVFVRLNGQGAEEWLRLRDGATVIRVPRGAYLQRPYEGGTAMEKPVAVMVESFFIDKHEVTNAQFARFLNASEPEPAWIRRTVPGLVLTKEVWSAAGGLERHPVTAATGHGALAYARWAKGAIPTRPQWEKAAGGAEGRMWPWGEEAPDAVRANFAHGGEPRGSMPVGSFAAGASPYGCLDMAGNVYDRVMMRTRDGRSLPVMIKGGSWLSPHPLNLRVLDMCVQPMQVADRSVGFRCALADPEPERPTRERTDPAKLKLARDWESAIAEARERRVPIYLSMHFDTCGQCDRTRAQLFRDPAFVAYCNKHLVVAVGHKAAPNAILEGHEEREDGSCPIYDRLECAEHELIFNKAIRVVERFAMSPGNFVLHPDRCEPGAGRKAILVPESELPKWGNPVEEYLVAFERARGLLDTR